MKIQQDVPVLIAGAGPTGLVLANELARRQVPFRLIDAATVPNRTSRSFTLHAKTMETFEHMGIAHSFLKDGIKSRGFYFNFLGKDAHPTLDFTVLDTRYPYILVYNQNETENRLREHLDSSYSVRPEWGTKLTSLKTGNGRYEAILIHESEGDREEVVHPQWIVGCDGVHSFVRNAIGLEYSGENYEDMLMQMMDVEFKGFEGVDDWVHYYMSKDNFLLITKLPGGHHRVLVSDMGEAGDPNLTAREAFQQLIEGHVTGSVLSEPSWATQWTIWKRLAKDYRKGNVFLAGDAAHVHSPSGGQGMNLGMQDAFNLGWKLAMVIRGEARPELLDTYFVERRPVGEQAIAGTDAMHDIIMAHGQEMQDRVELTQAEGWHEQSVKRISGLSYHYREAIEVPEGLPAMEGQVIGNRAQDVDLSDSKRLFDLFRHTRLTALIAPDAGDDEDGARCVELLRNLNQRFGHVLKCYVVSGQDVADAAPEERVLDEKGEFDELYGAGDVAHVYLVRPDGYIAFHGPATQPEFLFKYLDRYFNESDTRTQSDYGQSISKENSNMSEAANAGDAPIGIDVDAGKTYYWCACGKSNKQPLLRRVSQRH